MDHDAIRQMLGIDEPTDREELAQRFGFTDTSDDLDVEQEPHD